MFLGVFGDVGLHCIFNSIKNVPVLVLIFMNLVDGPSRK